MNRLYLPKIFGSKLQTRVVEVLLRMPERYFTLSAMARMLDASVGGIKWCVEHLREEEIVQVIDEGRSYLFSLNTKGRRAQLARAIACLVRAYGYIG